MARNRIGLRSTIYLDFELSEDFQVVFEVEARYAPVTPAQLYGPPEQCYPEEGGELERLEVYRVSKWRREPCPDSILLELVAAECKFTIRQAYDYVLDRLEQAAEEVEPDYPE